METFNQLNDRIIACRLCPRLAVWREQVAREKRRAYRDWVYWGKPVPGFGDPEARVLVVGLAPGAHGSNRTGRMFTGDASGEFLYTALYRAGFANQPVSRQRDDGLALMDIFSTAVCRCVPPDNRPSPKEIDNCFPYLHEEMVLLSRVQVIVALGHIAFDTILRKVIDCPDNPAVKINEMKFAHGASYQLGGDFPRFIASYHPSQQNTQTGRLTPSMFDAIWSAARACLH